MKKLKTVLLSTLLLLFALCMNMTSFAKCVNGCDTKDKEVVAIADAEEHMYLLNCSVCGDRQSYGYEKHTFKDGKCPACEYKSVVPGSAKIKSVKQTSKMKKKTKKIGGYWDAFGVWHKSHKAKVYTAKIKVSFKKAKNASSYYITTEKNWKNAISTKFNCWETTKTNFSFTYSPTNKQKKLTVYVIPMSSSHTYGKATKKTISLKY